MKQILITIAAVLVVGCGTTQQSVSPAESKPEPPPKDIWEAAEQGDIKAVKQFITAAGLDVSIHDASMEGNIDAIKRHLAAGTDPNLANLGERFLGDFIKPPLHFSKNKEVAELLIAGGADVNFKDQTGWAILHYWSFFRYGQLELIELLVANGADVNAKDRLGNTPLDKAIEGGYRWKSYKETREERAKIAEFLRKHGGKSGAPKSIVAAVNTGNVEAVKKHLSSGGEESKKIKDVFLTAVRMDHREIVGLLLSSGTDLKAKLDDSLHQAKSVEVAKLLIQKGANVNAKDEGGWVPLHSIINLRSMMPASDKNQNNSIQIVELLVTKGANVNALNDEGKTPLDLAEMVLGYDSPEAKAAKKESADILRKHGGRTSRSLQAAAESIEAAASEGDIEAVKKHLANGADVNAKGRNGLTTLQWAASSGHTEIVEPLIAAGADVNAKVKRGFTPLDLAEMVLGYDSPEAKAAKKESADILRKHGGKSGAADSLHVAAAVGNIEAVKQHLADGADVNAKDANGEIPLHIAATKEIAELLIANSAIISAKDHLGRTPLHWTALTGRREIVELLIAEGADVNAKNKYGRTTPLHFAASGGNKEIAELLIANGADVNAKDKWGGTPLHEAANLGHKEIVELLIAEGADVNAKVEGGLMEGNTPLDGFILEANAGFDAAFKEIADLLRKHGGKTGKELKAEQK
jgi:ankyrin repeat protein